MTLDPKGIRVGLLCTGLLGLLVVVGSRRLQNYDPALIPYTFAIVFATFGIAYRYAVWISRPPTHMYWRGSWKAFLTKGRRFRNTVSLPKEAGDNLVAQRFIAHRGWSRWLAHILISWGTMLAVAVTFPLVFGWIHFESSPQNQEIYRMFFFGFPVLQMHLGNFLCGLTFNALNISGVMVLVGVGLALRRRLAEPGAMALQQLGNDLMPLFLLFTIAVTGLMLTVSAQYLGGRGYSFFALTHAVVVIATLLFLPFGKFFHIFQRAAQVGVGYYKRAGSEGPAAGCLVCRQPFASRRQVEDLKGVLSDLDMRFQGPVLGGHYQDVCPRCRRRAVAFTQGRILGRG